MVNNLALPDVLRSHAQDLGILNPAVTSNLQSKISTDSIYYTLRCKNEAVAAPGVEAPPHGASGWRIKTQQNVIDSVLNTSSMGNPTGCFLGTFPLLQPSVG